MITTQEDLNVLKESFSQPLRIRERSALWQYAFEEYNELHPDQRPISMGCSACYGKVLQYFTLKINNQIINL